MRRVLIVSPYFPPSTLAGVHRARHLAKHLPATGWEPVIIAVDEAFHEERLDPDLAALVPATAEVVKVGALPARWTRPLGLGEISLRAALPLRRKVAELLLGRRFDAVLITGSPYYPMLMAPWIRRRFRVPVVLDFQDPWVSAWGADQPLFSKVGVAHRLAVALEPRALKGASAMTSVSDTQNGEMADRYPWLADMPMAGIPIGGDPQDFETLRAVSPGTSRPAPDSVELSYVGTFLPRAGPLVTTLFRAFARLRGADPAVAARLRFRFVGTSNQPNDVTGFRVRPLAEAEGVAAVVDETPQRLPYLDALRILSRSDGILLIGSDEPHYTASKIYPALMSGRPFLSLFHQASSAHAILQAAGGGTAHAFSTPEELAALEAPLAEALRTFVVTPQSFGKVDPAAYAPYEAQSIAARFAEVFDTVAARSGS